MIDKIMILLILIMLNAFFSAAEIALVSLNDNKIKVMADNGNIKAMHLVKLLSEPTRFLATIQIGITLAGFLASAFAAESFADPLVDYIKSYDVPIPGGALKATTVLIITIILAYMTLVFGELVPKRIGMQKSEVIAFAVVRPITVLAKATSPFVKLLTKSTNLVLRILRLDPHANEENVTEEEIRMLIDVGEEKGAIFEHEKFMINNIFEFNNKTAEDIMTHRLEMVSMPVSTSLSEILRIVGSKKYTRIPVYENEIDNIVGILYVKDLINLIDDEKLIEEFSLKKYIRKPLFVQNNKRIDELFMELQKARTHFAIVIDEYGGTEGIITLEDLIEEIVGEIFDEDDEIETDIIKIDDYTYEVDGLIRLDDMEKTFDIEFPVKDYETLSGFLIDLLGGIPIKNEPVEVEYMHLRFEIVNFTEKRIEKVIMHIENMKNVPNEGENGSS